MPCESCHVQFTVIRRKRSCADCKRFYCSGCLSTWKRHSNNSSINCSSTILLCERCSIFAKRPLLRSDLLQLKPKDLIFYLQSKHISTAGCVEKDELVGLVLNHVQQTDDVTATNSNFRSDTDSTTGPFDSLKQSCQNFFSNITENISDSFSAFDNKTTAKSNGQRRQSERGTAGNVSPHIYAQPRVSTREIPTYASYQSASHPSPTSVSVSASVSSPTHNPSVDAATVSTSRSGDQPTSPVVSLSLSSSSEGANNECAPKEKKKQTHTPVNNSQSELVENESIDLKSECDCSDDELMVTFSERALSNKNSSNNLENETLKSLDTDMNAAGPSKSSTTTGTGIGSGSYKADIHGGEISSQSSFEELGAIGGISDDSKTTTDTNSSNMDQWQILDNTMHQSEGYCGRDLSNAGEIDIDTRGDEPVTNVVMEDGLQVALLHQSQLQSPTSSQSQSQSQLHPPIVSQRVKKVTRRRSDSYLNRQRQRPASEDNSPTQTVNTRPGDFTLDEDEALDIMPTMQQASSNPCCHRCGKHKSSLRRQVEKMRRHLESSHMSEADIKHELQEFLTYLEKRSKSIECSDTETVASSLSGANCVQVTPVSTAAPTPVQQQRQWQWHMANDNEGIHVYPAATDSGIGPKCSRFINLEDFDSLKELECLSVKQLKEVLMLNRVDYKGCCEKQELLDRVERLWKNLKSAPAVDKLQTDELCKICMDAPIECVILECGHMATCTNCGKVLSECPICRQYIVRVVRFFRA